MVRKLENSSSFNKNLSKKIEYRETAFKWGTTFIVLSKDYMRVFLKYLEKTTFY